jgi:hypothetical protein
LNPWGSLPTPPARNGAYENIYQGELTLTYRLTESIQAFGGVQRSSRKQSFEANAINDTNIGIGLSAQF